MMQQGMALAAGTGQQLAAPVGRITRLQAAKAKVCLPAKQLPLKRSRQEEEAPERQKQARRQLTAKAEIQAAAAPFATFPQQQPAACSLQPVASSSGRQQIQEDPEHAEFMQFMRSLEQRYRASPTFLMHMQNGMPEATRARLIDWLVTLGEKLGLGADTLHLTVNYLDRFLSVRRVGESKLHLVGAACAWIAAKYEEIYAPSVDDIVHVACGASADITVADLVRMEVIVLSSLRYCLMVPTAKTFIRYLFQACKPGRPLQFLANYIAELAFQDTGMLWYLPSQIAAAALCLACKMLDCSDLWDVSCAPLAHCSQLDLASCMNDLAALYRSPSPVIHSKYAHRRMLRVADTPLPSTLE